MLGVVGMVRAVGGGSGRRYWRSCGRVGLSREVLMRRREASDGQLVDNWSDDG